MLLALLISIILVSHALSASPPIAATLTYKPENNEPMAPGFNTRIFNSVTYVNNDNDSEFNYDDNTGELTLVTGGVFRVSGVSIVTYMDMENHTLSNSSYPGYCTVSDTSTNAQIATGTISNAASMLPSTFDAIFEATEGQSINVQHQVGADVNNIWLGIAENGSSNHLYASLVLEKLS